MSEEFDIIGDSTDLELSKTLEDEFFREAYSY